MPQAMGFPRALLMDNRIVSWVASMRVQLPPGIVGTSMPPFFSPSRIVESTAGCLLKQILYHFRGKDDVISVWRDGQVRPKEPRVLSNIRGHLGFVKTRFVEPNRDTFLSRFLVR
jgi:hypothetical protein